MSNRGTRAWLVVLMGAYCVAAAWHLWFLRQSDAYRWYLEFAVPARTLAIGTTAAALVPLTRVGPGIRVLGAGLFLTVLVIVAAWPIVLWFVVLGRVSISPLEMAALSPVHVLIAAGLAVAAEHRRLYERGGSFSRARRVGAWAIASALVVLPLIVIPRATALAITAAGETADGSTRRLTPLTNACVDEGAALVSHEGLDTEQGRGLAAISPSLREALKALAAARALDEEHTRALQQAGLAFQRIGSAGSGEFPRGEIVDDLRSCPSTGSFSAAVRKALADVGVAALSTADALWRQERYDTIGGFAAWCPTGSRLAPAACQRIQDTVATVRNDPSVVLARDLPFLFDLTRKQSADPEQALRRLNVNLLQTKTGPSTLAIYEGTRPALSVSYDVRIARTAYGLLWVDVQVAGLTPAARAAVLDRYAAFLRLPPRPNVDCVIRSVDDARPFVAILDTRQLANVHVRYVSAATARAWVAARRSRRDENVMPRSCWATGIL